MPVWVGFSPGEADLGRVQVPGLLLCFIKMIIPQPEEMAQLVKRLALKPENLSMSSEPM